MIPFFRRTLVEIVYLTFLSCSSVTVEVNLQYSKCGLFSRLKQGFILSLILTSTTSRNGKYTDCCQYCMTFLEEMLFRFACFLQKYTYLSSVLNLFYGTFRLFLWYMSPYSIFFLFLFIMTTITSARSKR